jgi:hypothetical protein
MGTWGSFGSWVIPVTMEEKLQKLGNSFSADCVHLSAAGKSYLFSNLAKTVLGMREGTVGKPPISAVAAATLTVSGKRFYWRGFTSDRGSTSRPSNFRGRGRGASGSRGRGGQMGQARPAPYSRPVLQVHPVRGHLGIQRGGRAGYRGRGYL